MREKEERKKEKEIENKFDGEDIEMMKRKRKWDEGKRIDKKCRTEKARRDIEWREKGKR